MAAILSLAVNLGVKICSMAAQRIGCQGQMSDKEVRMFSKVAGIFTKGVGCSCKRPASIHEAALVFSSGAQIVNKEAQRCKQEPQVFSKEAQV